MASKQDRRIRIMHKLISKRRYPDKQLLMEALRNQELPVSERTFFSDMQALRDLGAEIEFCNHRQGYYYKRAFSLDQLPLSETDIEFIPEVLHLMEPYQGMPSVKPVYTFLEKLYASEGPDPAQRHAGLQHKRLHFEALSHRIRFQCFNDLLMHIRKMSVLRLSYLPYESGNLSPYLLVPLQLRLYDRRMYLIAVKVEDELRRPWRFDHHHIRIFALDRIREFQEETGYAVNQSHFHPAFNLDQYFAYGSGIYRNQTDPLVHLKLKARGYALNTLRELPINDTQSIEQQDACTIVSVQVLHNIGLINTLLQLKSEIEVLEPLEVRQDLMRHIREMAAVYAYEPQPEADAVS